MITAIFFDWFNTLARYQPPGEELQSQALREFSINVPPQQIMAALLVADRGLFEENTVSPIRERSPEEQADVYVRYQQTVLTEAGVKVPEKPDMLRQIIKRRQQLSQGMNFSLFDDVLTTLKMLKEQNLTLGLLTKF